MLRIITDFDGPIMDISERYYQTYQFCLARVQYPHQIVKQLTKSEFWAYKRCRTPEVEIAQISGLNREQAAEFYRLRQANAHSLPYFKYDRLVPGAIATLAKLQASGIDLVILTLRRVRELNYAFEQYPELEAIFPPNKRYCLPDDFQKTTDVADKPLLMQKLVAEESPSTGTVWMVGDTEADITAARQHHMVAVGVLSGIRDRQQLEIYQPDFIIDRLADLGSVVS